MASERHTEQLGEFEEADRYLRRTLPFEHILFLCVGSIIGSGWLFGSLAAMDQAGPSAVISWIVGAFFFAVIGLAFGEFGAMLPRSGGLARYPQLTHGAYTGWILGWTYWVSSIATPAIEASAVVTYVGGKFPSAGFLYESHGIPILTPTGIGFAIGLMIIFFILNIFGIRLLAEWNRWFTWWKIFIPITTFCFLFLVFKSSNFTAYGGWFPMGTGATFQTISISGIAFAYLGFRQAVEFGGEGRRPGRDIPLATLLSVGITCAIYVGLQIGMVGALGWGNAGISPGDWGALSGSTWGTTPLYSAMVAAGVPSMLLFGNFLLVDAGISPAGTGWIYLGTSTRAAYGLGIHGYGPKVLQRHNRFGIPWVAVVVAAVVGAVFFIPAPSWYELVGFITDTTVLTMIVAGMGVPVLRRYAPDLRRPYRLWAPQLLAPAAFCAAVVLVYWGGYPVLTNVEALIFVGLPLFTWYYAQRRGWIKPLYGWVLGLVFLGGLVYLERMGGWVLVPNPPSASRWSFGVYDGALSAAVVFFCLGLWLLSSKECRYHVQRTAWLIWMMLALFPASYFGAFGPLKHPPLPFPWMTLVVVGIGLVAYYWAVASGFYTEQLRDIVENREEAQPGSA